MNSLGITDPVPAQIILPPLALPTHPLLLNNAPQNDDHFVIRRPLKKRKYLKIKNEILEGTVPRIKTDYSCSNFEGTTFDTEFKKCVLSSVSFLSGTLKGKFIESIIQRSLFRDANLSNLYAEDTDFSHSSFFYLQNCQGAEYIRCTFFRCRFIKANLSKTIFSRSTFKEADFTYAVLTESLFEQASFNYANFTHANLINTDCSEADFTGANLSHAILKKTNLRGANLTGTNLSGTVFFKADLRGANLTDAVIDGTSFLYALIDKDTTGDIASMIAFGAHFIEEEGE